MREKLSKAESRTARLESSNTQLMEELKQTEKKYKQSRAEIRSVSVDLDEPFGINFLSILLSVYSLFPPGD